MRRFFVFLLVMLFVVSIFSVSFAEEKVLKIGAAVSMTGKFAREGKMIMDGYNFWKDYVNNRGGIKVGDDVYKVEIKYYDDKSDAQTSAKLTEKLITQDKVNFIFGPYSSNITYATSNINERYKVLMIASMANVNKIYTRGYKYIFAVLPLADKYMAPLLDFAKNEDYLNPKPKSVAVISANSFFPLAAAKGAVKYAKELGFRIVAFDKYPADAKDLSPVLSKIKTRKPDILISAGFYQHALLVTKQAKELKVTPKILGFTVGAVLPDFRESLKKDAEYIYGPEWWIPEMDWKCPIFGSTENYVKLITEEYGYVPDYHVAGASNAGVLLELAIKNAGSIETEKVREALSKLDTETFFGPIAFDKDGRNIKGSGALVQVQNNYPVPVYPRNMRGWKKAVYPMPPWDER
ncbi:MAG TPA: branched-chain amino acid ABC transporter substrate-binding protein [Candidatus Atribacteria bacterium]|nr:branched-chain amino acid ABC transporter substrate-binding protein [Candidatus Atribacteria bacterium]